MRPRTVKALVAGLLVLSLFLASAVPANVVECGPADDSPKSGDFLYDYDHSFTGVIVAARKIDRRMRLCGRSDVEPIDRSGS